MPDPVPGAPKARMRPEENKRTGFRLQAPLAANRRTSSRSKTLSAPPPARAPRRVVGSAMDLVRSAISWGPEEA